MVLLSHFLEVTLDQGPFLIPKDLRVQPLKGAPPREVSPEESIPPDPPPSVLIPVSAVTELEDGAAVLLEGHL